MLIVQATTPAGLHAEMAELTRTRSAEFGYRHVEFDLSPGPDLEGSEPPCTFKPATIRDGFQHADEDELVAWLDADAILVRPLDGLRGLAFDVAVTLREPHMLGPLPGRNSPASQYLNAGVVFFRRTVRAERFVSAWYRQSALLGNDQHGLWTLIGGDWTKERWAASYGRTVHAAGALCLILDGCGDGWNTWQFNPVAEDAKILHFKGALRRKHDWRRIASEVNCDPRDRTARLTERP